MNEDPVKITYTEPNIGAPDGSMNLEEIFGMIPMVASIPTWTPIRFRDGFACDTTRAIIYYYDFTNNVWKTVTTNRRNVVSITTASSYTINTDVYDTLSITALAGTINTIAVSGTPNNFDTLIVRIKDNGTSQTIAWSTDFASYGSTLPTATTISKVLTVGFLYDSVAALWGCVAVQLQP